MEVRIAHTEVFELINNLFPNENIFAHEERGLAFKRLSGLQSVAPLAKKMKGLPEKSDIM